MHGNFHTPKSIRVKCLPAWKFPYTQKYMPYSGQVLACMEISIHPKVYAVVFACLEISIHPKVCAVVFAYLEISIHPKVYVVVFACLEISMLPKVYTCRAQVNCCMNFFMQVYTGQRKRKLLSLIKGLSLKSKLNLMQSTIPKVVHESLNTIQLTQIHSAVIF